MPSPFPGVDPYLEHPALWRGVHHTLIVGIAHALGPILRPRCVAAIRERLYETALVRGPGRRLIPDEEKELFLEIRAVPGGDVVTRVGSRRRDASEQTLCFVLECCRRLTNRADSRFHVGVAFLHVFGLADGSIQGARDFVECVARLGGDHDARRDSARADEEVVLARIRTACIPGLLRYELA